MRVFRRALEGLQKSKHSNSDLTWFYVAADQLSLELGPRKDLNPKNVGFVFVESLEQLARRPYHKQKLALLLANQRHFALESARAGITVEYVQTKATIADSLSDVTQRLGSLRMLEAAELELRCELEGLQEAGHILVEPHPGWLTSIEDFRKSQKARPPWRMDAFYRHVRKRTGILMDDGKPRGGKFSFDTENRKPWSGQPPAARPPEFEIDDITGEVGQYIADVFGTHPGQLELNHLPVTQQHAEKTWSWALEQCLPNFGPFEDAMHDASTTIFHTRISALLNLHRLLPERIINDTLQADIPLASQEGFIRQVIGWREFVRHVHHETAGFRTLPETGASETAEKPGDGGHHSWRGDAWLPQTPPPPTIDGGSTHSALDAKRPLPPAYWGKESGLNCLDSVVSDVWRESYSHHITRLMVLSNIATMLDVSPRELTDWFWVAYVDAFDWVVEPNVMGMGTFGLGELFTTKPYVSGGAYIKKMSNYCDSCSLAQECPITRMYWAFLSRHRHQLEGNARLRMMMASEKKREETKKRADAEVFEYVSHTLLSGETVQSEKLRELTHEA